MAQVYSNNLNMLNDTRAPENRRDNHFAGRLRPPPMRNEADQISVARPIGIHDEGRLLRLWTRLSSGEPLRASPGENEKEPGHDQACMKIMEQNRQAVTARIVDADASLEVTRFINNKLLTQSAVAGLSQGPTLQRTALALIL